MSSWFNNTTLADTDANKSVACPPCSTTPHQLTMMQPGTSQTQTTDMDGAEADNLRLTSTQEQAAGPSTEPLDPELTSDLPDSCGQCEVLEESLQEFEMTTLSVLRSIEELDAKIAVLKSCDAQLEWMLLYVLIQKLTRPKPQG